MTTENLEQKFLEYVCAHKLPLTVFLVNGVKLHGQISEIDDASVVLSRAEHSQLVYRHAISTIMPDAPVEIA